MSQLKRKKHKLSKKRTFLLFALISGTIWSWIFFIDIAKLSRSSFTAYATILFVFLLIVGITALLFTVCVTYLRRYSRKRQSPFLLFFRIVGVWALTELLVSWVVAVIWIGKNGSWDSTLPFTSVAPIVIWTPLKFLTRFFGYYGISGIIIAGIVSLFHKRLRPFSLYIWAGIILLSVLGWSLFRSPQKNSLLTTAIASHLGSVPHISTSTSELVVLPEYGLDQVNPSALHNYIASNKEVYFVGTYQKPDSSGVRNVLAVGSNRKGYISKEIKTRLIPGGEYLPYISTVPLKLLDNATYNNFQVQRAVIKGTQPITPITINRQVILGSEACSSIISTEDYRKLANQGATLLTNSASLDIFRGSLVFDWQQKSFAAFMAVANNRYFIQSANDGAAYALSSSGKQLAFIKPENSADLRINTISQKTPYTKYGEWVVLIGVIFIAYDGIDFFTQRKHKPPAH